MNYGGYNPYYGNQPQNGGIVWVQGEAGAKSYMVAPGSTVLLMDSEGPTFYIKATDASGMPQPLRVFDFKERQAAVSEQAPDASKFVTWDELKKYLDDMKKEGADE